LPTDQEDSLIVAFFVPNPYNSRKGKQRCADDAALYDIAIKTAKEKTGRTTKLPVIQVKKDLNLRTKIWDYDIQEACFCERSDFYQSWDTCFFDCFTSLTASSLPHLASASEKEVVSGQKL